jgi:hypothetical protein
MKTPTPDDFRRMALAMKDVREGAHMGHPDFRVHERIFATLHADNRHGMVKLPLETQAELVRTHPGAFAPASGAWGRSGSTIVTLAGVDEETLGEALTLARQHVAQARPARAVTRSEARTPGPNARRGRPGTGRRRSRR